MQPKPPHPDSLTMPNRPDPRLLEILGRVQAVCLILAASIALAVLAGRLLPTLSTAYPSGWTMMRPNTALALLFSVASLSLSQPRRSPRQHAFSRILASVVFLWSFTIFLEYALRFSLKIDPLLDLGSLRYGRMSPQTAAALTALGLVMPLVCARKRMLAHVADVMLLILCLIVLTILSGYLFGAVHLFGQSVQNRTSPQTLFALGLLTFAAYARHAEYGFHAVLLGAGIGGKIARATMPLAIVLPILLEALRAGSIHLRLVGVEYANAIAVSALSICTVVLTLLVAWRVDRLERRIQDLSLRDELTKLYNRRGLYFLGEQMMRLARRVGKPFSILYLDLDRLKHVNDTLGHEVGIRDAGRSCQDSLLGLPRQRRHRPDRRRRVRRRGRGKRSRDGHRSATAQLRPGRGQRHPRPAIRDTFQRRLCHTARPHRILRSDARPRG
jgi:hypothetical protein